MDPPPAAPPRPAASVLGRPPAAVELRLLRRERVFAIWSSSNVVRNRSWKVGRLEHQHWGWLLAVRQLHQRQPASERWQPFRRRWRGRLDFTTSEWWSFRLFYKQCCPPGWRWRSLWRRSQQARNPGYHRIGRSLRWRCSSRLYTRAATPARFLVVWRRIGSAPAARPATAATTATAGWRSLWRCGAASASFGAVFVWK